jgi:hypothetical protein
LSWWRLASGEIEYSNLSDYLRRRASSVQRAPAELAKEAADFLLEYRQTLISRFARLQPSSGREGLMEAAKAATTVIVWLIWLSYDASRDIDRHMYVGNEIEPSIKVFFGQLWVKNLLRLVDEDLEKSELQVCRWIFECSKESDDFGSLIRYIESFDIDDERAAQKQLLLSGRRPCSRSPGMAHAVARTPFRLCHHTRREALPNRC